MKTYMKRIEEYANDVHEMYDRATCRFSSESIKESHVEITKNCAKRLVYALGLHENVEAALKDYHVQSAIYIGEKYDLPGCAEYSNQIQEIRREQRRIHQRNEDIELFDEIIYDDTSELSPEDIEEFYKTFNKHWDYLNKDQQERALHVHSCLAEIAEDREAAEQAREAEEAEQAQEALLECVLCQHTFEGFGHNAEPLSVGYCCSGCNEYLVIPSRIKQFFSSKK